MAGKKKNSTVGETSISTEAAAQDALVGKDGAASSQELNISEKLKAAAGNIRRADAGARARKTEQEKSQKQSEAEAKARREEAERKLKDEQARAKLVAEQKLAALDYAQNYRKKLMKDRQKAMSAARLREKEEREAKEALEREEKAKEVAALLEKEREEARVRGERATELLNRVTKCAVVDENGNLRLVDKMEALKERAEEINAARESAAEAARKAAEESARKAAEEKQEPEYKAPKSINSEERKEAARREVEEFLVGEMMTVDGDKFILNIEEEDMTVSLTENDDPRILPKSAIPEETVPYEPEAEPTPEPVLEPAPVCESCAEEKAPELTDADVIRSMQASARLAREEMKRMIDEEHERFAAEIEALRSHR